MLCCYRRSAAIVLSVLVVAGLSGCYAAKQRVEPYQEKPPLAVVTTPPPPKPAQVQPPAPAVAQKLPAKSKAPEELLPLLRQVDDRIAAYEDKAHTWEEIRAGAEKLAQSPELGEKVTGCQERLQGILAGYNSLHEQLIGMGPGIRPGDAVMDQLQKSSGEDIAFLESECQQLVTGGQEDGGLLAGSAAGILAEGEKAIAAAMATNDYPQVISLFEQLPVAEGMKPYFAGVYSYGQALLRSGREQEAEKVFSDLLQDIQQQNQVGREFQLMQLLADIRFGREDYGNAFNDYVRIINNYAGLGENIEWARKQQLVISARNQQPEEVKGFADLMRAYLGLNQVRDGFKVVLLAERFLAAFPESAVTPTVNRILFEARDSAEAWYTNTVQQITGFKDAGKFAEAVQVLDGLPLQDLPADKQAQLQALAEEMRTTFAREAETKKVAAEAALQETWTRGTNHLQLKEYDQAIAVFSTLQDTAYAEQASGQIKEAADLAAQEDRQKAAELFVQASSAKDQAARVELLLQSRQLLQNILSKYPQSNLVEKVRKNLEKIEQDLRGIDPSLLAKPAPASEQGDNAQSAASAAGEGTMNVGELQVPR